MIVTSAGLNIYPEDLEAALRNQPGIRDCLVVPDPRRGNAEPCAVLLLEDSTAALTIIAQANAKLAEYQRIREYSVWPELDFPRTPTGKPRLKQIISTVTQTFHDSSQAGSSPSETASTAVATLVASFHNKSTAPGAIDDSLHLSSLDRVELMAALEERFQVELNETSFAQAQTLGDLQRLVQHPDSNRAQSVYPRWAQREFIRAIRLAIYYLLVWPATRILAHPKIVGRENLSSLHGPALFVSNHITRRADIGLVLAALPHRYRHHLATAMGGETLLTMRRPPAHWFFVKRWVYQIGYGLATALFNVFPLPQQSGFRESFRFAGESVDRGYSLLVFPEGIINDRETSEIAPFQSGIGLLAENLRLPIVPMRLDGLWQMKRERRRLAHFGEITVRIGPPITFPPGTLPNEIARALESLVRAL